MNFKILMIYLVFFQMLNATLYWEFYIPPIINVGFLFVASIYFLVVYHHIFLRNRLFLYSTIYIILLFLTLAINNDINFHTIARCITSTIVVMTIEKRDYKYLKPIFYILLIFFISNATIALYERITMSYFLPIKPNDDIMEDQAGGMIYTYGDEGFRAFALLGHPLTNANIMAYMSFCFYFCNILNIKFRVGLLLLGYASLFAFNARGAILIMTLLLVPITFIYLKTAKNKFITLAVLGLILYYGITYFNVFAGRLVSGEIKDDSSMVRILAIREFLSLDWRTLLMGGYKPMYGENGYLMTIEVYGLIVGGYKIFFELFFCYKIIPPIKTLYKVILILSVIGIGSTNNNLFYAKVFPFYVLSVLFILISQGYETNKRIV